MLILEKLWCWILGLIFGGWFGISCDINSRLCAAVPERTSGETTILTVDALATRIDALIAVQQKSKHVQPASLSDDAEFIRRVYLDLTGCIPSVADVKDFLDDPRSDKRRIWIDELFQGQKPSGKRAAYARHFANVWRAWLLSGLNDQQVLQQTAPLETWLYQQLRKNTSYDYMVRELLTGKQVARCRTDKTDLQEAFSSAFLQANANKPDQLAMSTARLFLGMKMDCARCHEDRSGGSWTQADFWSFAACFVEATKSIPKIEIEGTHQFVSACFPDGSKPKLQPGTNSRQALAAWLTTPANPYLAKATVNRLWSYFFGIGLVDPVDAGGDHNPPSHPQLLDLLAQQFVLHQFDLQYLVRALVNSHTYQRSSTVAAGEQVDPRLFSRMMVRALSVEQLFDSLAEATELFDPAHGPAAGVAGAPQALRAKFLELFTIPGQRTQPETSMLQALYLMNSDFIADRTSLGSNATLATIAAATRGGTARQMEMLFLVVLSRKPRADEAKRYIAYVDRAGQRDDQQQALADVFWVLLNSAEFRHNH